MRETLLFELWAKFHNMSQLEKRRLLTKYLAEKTGITCEIRLYRSITRLSFQTYKKKLGKLLQDDLAVESVLKDLKLNAQTAMTWYLYTKDKVPFKPETAECNECPLNGLCEYSIPKELWQGIKDKYGYLLVSRRMQHVLIKKERFKAAFNKKTGISDDGEIRRLLRRAMEKKHYNQNLKLTPLDEKMAETLKEENIGPVAVIKWFYIIKNAQKNLEKAAKNQIEPDEAESLGIEELREDIRKRRLEVKE